MPTVPDIHRRGTRAAQTALVGPLTVGTLWFVTDEGVTERWTGTAWESYSGPGTGAAPTAHASSHEPGGSDAMAVDAAAGTGSLRTLGTGALQAAAGTDARFTDARTPTAHHASHESGGSDAIKLDDLSAPDDNTDLNASTGAHGLLRKLSGIATEFLNGLGGFSVPATAITRPLTFGFPGAALAVGQYFDVYVPYACTITSATCMGDVAGSVVFDVLTNASYASAPASSIVASAPPTLSGALGSQDTTLTGWSKTLTAGTRVRGKVTSTSGLSWAVLTLTVTG